MSAARSSDDATAADPTPLLSGQRSPEDSRTENRRSIRRGQSLRDAARFLRRASSRRLMREPSMLVREAAAEQLEERQSDWSYSRPVVVLDILWNFTFVAVAASFLVLSWNEKPSMPLRVWIVGYAMQCVLHIFCVLSEYRKRQRRFRRPNSPSGTPTEQQSSSLRGASSEYVSLAQMYDENTGNVTKYLQSANSMFSFVWWIIGFYWVSAGGQALIHDAPQLYWVCIIFLGFDVFFVVFCVALACVIGVAVCCCLPCIIAILYAVSDQEGASKEDIEQLPRFKFQIDANAEKVKEDGSDLQGGVMIGSGSTESSPTKHYLSQEDAECCICLCAYEDGVELRELPCRHHFHCSCVDKWLHINATCPLCKYNILKSSHGDEEV